MLHLNRRDLILVLEKIRRRLRTADFEAGGIILLKNAEFLNWVG